MSPEGKPPPRRHRTSFLRKLAFSLVPVLLLGFFLEVGFRIAGCGRPERLPRTDPTVRTFELESPDGRRSQYREMISLGVPHRVSELRYRDWLYEEKEREGAFRIVGIGDSFMEGHGVRYEEVWLQVLGDRLRRGLPQSAGIRTLNFGDGGRNTAQVREALEDHVLRFNPDLLILGFTVYNDAQSRKAYEKATTEGRKEHSRTSFRLAKWVKDHSYFVNWVVERLRREKRRRSMREHLEQQYADSAPGWEECRENLTAIARICRERDLPLLVAVFPVHHDDIALNDWENYEHRDIHEKVASVLAPFPEVRVVDLVDGFGPLTGQKIWIDVDRHPTPPYHALVAELLEGPVFEILREKGVGVPSSK